MFVREHRESLRSLLSVSQERQNSSPCIHTHIQKIHTDYHHVLVGWRAFKFTKPILFTWTTACRSIRSVCTTCRNYLIYGENAVANETCIGPSDKGANQWMEFFWAAGEKIHCFPMTSQQVVQNDSEVSPHVFHSRILSRKWEDPGTTVA